MIRIYNRQFRHQQDDLVNRHYIRLEWTSHSQFKCILYQACSVSWILCEHICTMHGIHRLTWWSAILYNYCESLNARNTCITLRNPKSRMPHTPQFEALIIELSYDWSCNENTCWKMPFHHTKSEWLTAFNTFSYLFMACTFTLHARHVDIHRSSYTLNCIAIHSSKNNGLSECNVLIVHITRWRPSLNQWRWSPSNAISNYSPASVHKLHN